MIAPGFGDIIVLPSLKLLIFWRVLVNALFRLARTVNGTELGGDCDI